MVRIKYKEEYYKLVDFQIHLIEMGFMDTPAGWAYHKMIESYRRDLKESGETYLYAPEASIKLGEKWVAKEQAALLEEIKGILS